MAGYWLEATSEKSETWSKRTGIVNVVTMKAGKQVLTPTPVVLGLVGDSLDQIISGVKAGAVLAIKSSASSVSSSGFPSVGVPAGGAAAALGGGGRFGG